MKKSTLRGVVGREFDKVKFMLPPYFKIGEFMAADGQIKDWGIQQLHIEQIWQQTQGEGVRVLVIDTGKPDHADLVPNLMSELCFDATGEGVDDKNGHSTFVSSIICASGQGVSTYGYAPKAKFATAKALDSRGVGDINWTSRCLQFAVDNSDKFDIINMSLGAPIPIGHQRALIKELVTRNKIVFCAAGNAQRSQTRDTINYPAAYPETVAIAAYDSNGNLAPFSSWGKEVDFAFPGVDNIGCGLHQSYARMSGTSFACPAAAGVAALLISKHRKLQDGDCQTPAQITQHFIDSSIDKGIKGSDNKWGHGIIDILKLFQLQ